MTRTSYPGDLCWSFGYIVKSVRMSMFISVVWTSLRQFGYEGCITCIWMGWSGWCLAGWECAPRVIRRCVPRVIRGRVPYNAPIFNLLILREQKMGGLKIIGFLKLSLLFALIGPRGERGEERERHLWKAVVSVYFQKLF